MSINSFVCPICGNNDIHSIGYLNGKPYCHRCIKVQNSNPIYGSYYKKRKKSPVNGATQFPVSRHQTSDDHDHGYIKSKERR